MPRAKSSQIPADIKLIEGAEKRLGSATLMIAGETYATQEIIALIKERTEIDAAVHAARNILKVRIDASRASHAKTDAIVSAFKQVVHGMFAGSFEGLESFGLTPRKRRKPATGEEQLRAAAKAKATREARHTMGKRAKLKIKGVVPAAPPSPALATRQVGSVAIAESPAQASSSPQTSPELPRAG